VSSSARPFKDKKEIPDAAPVGLLVGKALGVSEGATVGIRVDFVGLTVGAEGASVGNNDGFSHT
jgi:hypothetical protein